jgi:hypothetical protein
MYIINATSSDTLQHFGVKGMRWGVRRRPNSGFSDDQRAEVRSQFGKRGVKRVNKRLNKGRTLDQAVRTERRRRTVVRVAVVIYGALVAKQLADRFGPELLNSVASRAAAKNGARAAAETLASRGITNYQTLNATLNAATGIFE